MKTTLKKAAAVGLTALVIGNAAAQESVSKPVGYETLIVNTGINYLGVRLHETVATSGVLPSDPAGAVVTLEAGVLDALTPGAPYIFEVTGGDGAGDTEPVVSFDAGANTVTLATDLSANLFSGDSFQIRPASTLVSVFGEASDPTLAPATAPGDADQVWIPIDGGFSKYYKYSFIGTTEWRDVDTNTAVDATTVPLYYSDGIIVSATAPTEVVVSGSVKLENTNVGISDGINYLGSVYPVGATLLSYFGDAATASGSLDGASSPGDADQVWVVGDAGFDKYYINSFIGTFTWRDADANTEIDPDTVELSSGFIIQNTGGPSTVFGSSPSFYGDL